VRDDQERLLDILEAIGNIERRLNHGRQEFIKDELLQVWVIHHISIIGEAANGTTADFRRAHPEIPWADIISTRNFLVHQYFGVDLQQIWDTVTNDLPKLKHQITSLLKH
jgi:uncharacterized protein with HEPN domain